VIGQGVRARPRGPREAATWVRSLRESPASCRALRQPGRAEIHRIPGTPRFAMPRGNGRWGQRLRSTDNRQVGSNGRENWDPVRYAQHA
jgi:hypothetical protein